MPVHKRASTHPKLLSLPTPSPGKAYHDHYAEYRPIPGGGPADNPTSHWGKVVYAGDRQVNHNQEERVSPVEELAPPDAGRCSLGVPTDFARTLLLCMHWLRDALHAARCPKGYQLHY